MNTLIWIGQIALASVFLVAGIAKLVAYRTLVRKLEQRRNTAPIQVTTVQGYLLAVLEIAGAIGVIWPPALTPASLFPGYLLVRISAAWLALIMVGATAYHFRRRESAAPSISAFLLALFVIVGRWPH